MRGQRKAHWPGATASDVAIETKLKRLLPVQSAAKSYGVAYVSSFLIMPLVLLRDNPQDAW